jgi:hypothetical protein
MKLHRFVHLGDLHLQHAHPRNGDRLQALDRAIDHAKGLPGPPALAAWLMPGDLFHAKSTAEDRNALAIRLQRMADEAPVVICPGNHDAPGDLDIFAKLKARWPVIVRTTPCVEIVQLASDAVAAVGILPYPQKAGLVAAGVAHQDLGAAATAALDAIFMQLAGDLAEARHHGAIPIFMGHVNVAGSQSSNGQPQIGMELELDRAMLARLQPIPYIGLNHIHFPQTIDGATYAGSICRLDFGETEPKRFVVVEIDDVEFNAVIVSVPIDTPPLYHVEGDLARDGFTWQVTKGPGGAGDSAPASWAGCGVRVRYRYRASEKSVLSTAPILATFAEAKPFQLEGVAVPDRALRAPAVAAAVTLEDKFTAYCGLGGSPVTPAMLEKLALVEQKDAAQVWSVVDATIRALESEQEAVLV